MFKSERLGLYHLDIVDPSNENILGGSEADMLWHNKMVRPNIHMVKEMIHTSQHGRKTIDKKDSQSYTSRVQTQLTMSPSNGKMIENSEDIKIHADK